ncbi:MULTISPECIES: 3'(2'),5'-bisphosphate nucleotidase CysQ [Micromonospora]|uniref:3'(2'),5-bisphosphonucleoside 3'(2')-phosphohydrolase n=1 Tax=Micromonospora yangpuensis TaxID=683228 RepID=A0A1C6UN17_9ACTN|nr:3'(2'),5'-bisphosphate nucleotidase CysQ [Micromonospora yangpuensis]SCL55400.1 3'(2'),5'-bisphosphate nucleotidase [Micromonospora yangpuensis]
MNPTESDPALARRLAARAGELLLWVRAAHGHDDPATLKAAGDRAAHDFLRTELARCRPADAVLSEEDVNSRTVATEAGGRLTADRVWIIDPLDGTREFSEAGRSDWAVHVALWARDAPTSHRLVAAAVGLPAQLRVLTTQDRPARPDRSDRRVRLAASRSRPPAFLTELAAEVGAELVPMGSAGAKIAAVVTGEVDAYIHAGGQYEWDSAAPVAVATATGLHASRIDGSALKYNEADPRLPDLLVCRTDLAGPLLAALHRHLSGTVANRRHLSGTVATAASVVPSSRKELR